MKLYRIERHTKQARNIFIQVAGDMPDPTSSMIDDDSESISVYVSKLRLGKKLKNSQFWFTHKGWRTFGYPTYKKLMYNCPKDFTLYTWETKQKLSRFVKSESVLYSDEYQVAVKIGTYVNGKNSN